MKSRSPSGNSGFSLVETLIAMVAISVIIIAYAQSAAHSALVLRHQRLRAGRDRVVSDLAKVIAMPGMLRENASHASGLMGCLFVGSSTCSHNSQPFALYGSKLDPSGYGTVSVQLTGTQDNPVVYDIDGLPCGTGGAGQCSNGRPALLKAWTSAELKCPPKGSNIARYDSSGSCKIPDDIKGITIIVSLNVEPVASPGDPKSKPVQSNPLFVTVPPFSESAASSAYAIVYGSGQGS